MPKITVARTINAPVERVFEVVADVRKFSQALPHVVNIEFLTEQKTGEGAKYRETRLMKGKETINELEVTEYVENERVRIVADNHGTIWDTIFTVTSDGDATLLTMVMDAKAYKLLSGLMNRLIVPLIRGAVASDMDAVKAFCEKLEADTASEC